MKIKKMIGICKQNKTITLFNCEDGRFPDCAECFTEWLGMEAEG